MSTHRLAVSLLAALVIMIQPVAASVTGEESSAPAAEVTRALESVRDGTVEGLHLRVVSSSGEGLRSMEIFERGVGIWNGTVQIRLTPAVRSAVLGALLESGFAGFEERYGGRPEPDGDGALRVIRQVALDVGGVSKMSVQLADGEQSAALERLAESLLDLVAPLAATGVTADDMADGLAKLAAGSLAPEVLMLRLVEMPSGGDEVGSILRVERGAASRQPYAPGRTLGEPEPIELSDGAFGGMVAALRRADPESLPVNLWSPRHVELEVQVLQHGHTVIARPFSRRSPEEDAAVRARFDELVATLDALGVEPVAPAESGDASD